MAGHSDNLTWSVSVLACPVGQCHVVVHMLAVVMSTCVCDVYAGNIFLYATALASDHIRVHACLSTFQLDILRIHILLRPVRFFVVMDEGVCLNTSVREIVPISDIQISVLDCNWGEGERVTARM